jgi:hypothetical protein
MADELATAALVRKRAELAGRIGHARAELDAMLASLAALDATLRLFDPELRPQAIRPKPFPPRRGPEQPGMRVRDVLGALRETGRPMTTRPSTPTPSASTNSWPTALPNQRTEQALAARRPGGRQRQAGVQRERDRRGGAAEAQGEGRRGVWGGRRWARDVGINGRVEPTHNKTGRASPPQARHRTNVAIFTATLSGLVSGVTCLGCRRLPGGPGPTHPSCPMCAFGRTRGI